MGGLVRGLAQPKSTFKLTVLIMVAFIALPLAVSTVNVPVAHAATQNLPVSGNLDCNGYSPLQKPAHPYICADIGREDNEHYIGHDEPSVQFLSSSPGSGNNVEWVFKLPKEHPLPATQTFENQNTFWFSMALCDPSSFPFNPCIPDSDQNPPALGGASNSTTAGSAILELQFYPPGGANPPTPSCSLTTWCAALNIDSFEGNPNCMEPINFQFIQTNGVPGNGTPNANTLLMGQGDKIEITIQDTPNGLLNRIDDATTGQSGFMVASAANGFFHTDPATCAMTPFSFHPEFSTAKFGNFNPWLVLQANVGFASETGHFEPGSGDGDVDDTGCTTGPVVPGCYNLPFSTGDTDFDGAPYQPDWPDGTKHTPTPVTFSSDLGNGIGPVSAPLGQNDHDRPYPTLMFETPVLGTEVLTGTCCSIPPAGATFYPFYAQSGFGAHCVLTFGNDIRGATVNDFGRDAQYGTQNLVWLPSGQLASSSVQPNPCIPHGGGEN